MKIDPSHDFGRKECPNCAMEIAKNENACPICGYVFPARPRGVRALWAAVALLVAAVLLFLLL